MTRRRPLALVVALGIAAAIPLSSPAPAQAFGICKAGYQCIRWYYSNSTYTTLVGSTYYFCDGTTSTVGTITGYVRVENDLCG